MLTVAVRIGGLKGGQGAMTSPKSAPTYEKMEGHSVCITNNNSEMPTNIAL